MRRTLLSAPLGLAVLLGMVPPLPAVAGGGGHCPEPRGDKRTVTIALVGSCFAPTVARVPVGGTVTWVNTSGMLHNISGPPRSVLLELQDTASTKIRFSRAGYFPYACTYHSMMTGLVVVGTPGREGIAEPVVVQEPAYSSGGAAGHGAPAEPASGGTKPADAAPAGAEPAGPAEPAVAPPTKTEPVASTAAADGFPAGWGVAALLLTLLAAGLVLGAARQRAAEPA